LPLLALLVLVSAACDDTIGGAPGTPTSPSAATSTDAPVTESFEATLSAGQSTFYSFSVTTAGPATATLAAVAQPGKAGALATPLRIAFGTPVGEGCEISDSIEAPPSLTPQLGTTLSAGIHCVSIGDSGQLTGTVIASVRFAHH
jgi:hypothetical protein